RIWGLTRNTGLGKHVTEHRDHGVTLHDAAAPHATLRFVLYALPVGLAFLVPSLWLLFRVFMGTLPSGADLMKNPTAPGSPGPPAGGAGGAQPADTRPALE